MSYLELLLGAISLALGAILGGITFSGFFVVSEATRERKVQYFLAFVVYLLVTIFMLVSAYWLLVKGV